MTSSAQDCHPNSPNYGPLSTGAQYISNGDPDGTTNCWTPWNVSPSSTTCEVYPQWIATTFQFDSSATLDQGFTVPATDTFNYFSFTYFLDFENRSQSSAWDLQLDVEIRDQTTGTVLMTDHYDASQPSLICARRDLPGYFGSLSGHSINVHLTGNRTFTNDRLHVFGIQLYGNHN